jgi:ubiquinone/menaquinone biosynthesis C-methylase UbiE
MTTAGTNELRWGAGATVRAEHYARMSHPAWVAVADATGVGEGTRLLDVGCGSGEFCRLAADRGATVSGLDVAEPMIDLARRLMQSADLRVGNLEHLPWPDESFDLVTGFNSLHFAGDLVAALAEARRVVRPGLVAVCNWGRGEDCQQLTIWLAVRHLAPPHPSGRRSASRACWRR